MAKKIKYALNNEEFYKSFLAGKKPEEGKLFISGGKTHDGVWLIDNSYHFARAIRPRAGQIIISKCAYAQCQRALKYIMMYGPKKLQIIESKAAWNPVASRPTDLCELLFDDVVRYAQRAGNMTHGDACLLYNQILRDLGWQRFLAIPSQDTERDD